MISSIELLDAVKHQQECTDYRVGKLLGMGPSYISNIRTGRMEFGEETAVKAAKLAGLDPAWVLVGLAAWKARDGELGPIWERAADQVKAA